MKDTISSLNEKIEAMNTEVTDTFETLDFGHKVCMSFCP